MTSCRRQRLLLWFPATLWRSRSIPPQKEYAGALSDARTIEVKIRLRPDELTMIEEQMAKVGTSNRENYIRRMATEGSIRTLDMNEIKKLNRLLAAYGNNLNQIAKRLNSTGRLYEVDMQDIVTQFHTLVEQVKKVEYRLLEKAV